MGCAFRYREWKLRSQLRLWAIALLSVIFIAATPEFLGAQSPSPNSSPSPEIIQAPVVLDGNTLFYLEEPFLSESVEERAARVSNRIEFLAKDESISADAPQVTETEAGSSIYAEDVVLLTITDKDAELAEQPRQLLARNYTQLIKDAVTQYRLERSGEYRIRAIAIAIVSTVILILILLVLNNITPQFYHWLDDQQDRWIPNVRIQNVELLSSAQLSTIIEGITRLLHTILVIGLCIIYFSFVLGLFPNTRQFGYGLVSYSRAGIAAVWNGFLDYIPNLFTILFILLLAHYFLRFLRFFLNNISRRRLSIPGFYPEWANPTFNLLRLLTIALSAALCFPYLPGATSPAFQGISIFLGLLLSLGSGGALVSLIAGSILVYTRAFQPGDRIQVGDVEGFVEEKSLLVTRIRTLNNLLVSVPNSTLLSSNITNYGALMRDQQTPIILSTTVTLGYDVPWREVHEALITAALNTPDILSEPKPVVWQTALNDFYVNYELRACTKNSSFLETVYSALHQNIQDQCNSVGIEILSPHYGAIRDGNQTTIPSSYLPNDYQVPGFRIFPGK